MLFICRFKIKHYLCIRNSGCSSARLEYASGGRVVAGSNPVTPTGERGKILIIKPLFYFSTLFSTPFSNKLRKKGTDFKLGDLTKA